MATDAAEATHPTGPTPSRLTKLGNDFRAGRTSALARAISLVESGRSDREAVAHELLVGPPKARRVGFTGPPGAGKSSLITEATTKYRAADERVGIIAVDPTSPYSGGALLGDRIRMNDLAVDRGVFIRSMATRGSLGGLAGATREVVDLVDAFGFGRVLVETVGVGQTELEIASAADTVVVVLVPESGDSIQAMKAGLTEIADIFVVNKADRPGADRLASDLRQAIRLREGVVLKGGGGHHGVDLTAVKSRSEDSRQASHRPSAKTPPSSEDQWRVPVLMTIAHRSEGTGDLLSIIEDHRAWLERSGELGRRRAKRARRRVHDAVEATLLAAARSAEWAEDLIASRIDRLTQGIEPPHALAREIVARLLREGVGTGASPSG